MTEKQEQILSAALTLFSKEGFDATATSKVARQAGVSEGLIFRHFKNKRGLLDALITQAEEKTERMFAPIFSEDNPIIILRKTIGLPFHIPKDDYDFWRLQFKLKWEPGYQNLEKVGLLIQKLSEAFQALNYDCPDYEARLLTDLLDAIATEILKGNTTDLAAYESFLLKKYQAT